MKRISCIFLYLLASLLSAAESTQEVLVTLPNGLQQKALYFGIHQDTVHLGGVVNGQPTTVKIPRNRIQSLVLLPSNTPIDLQTPPAPAVPEDSTNMEQATPAEHDWLGHMLVLAPESSTLDSLTKANIHGLTLQLLREKSGMPVLSPSPEDLQKLANTDALVLQMKQVGALGLVGSQWKVRNDTLMVTFRIIWTRGDSLRTSTASKISTGKNLSEWLLSETPWTALEKGIGIPLFPVAKERTSEGYVWVETEPDGAFISVNDELPICKSPCRVPATPDSSGHIILRGAWKVTNHLWAGKTTLTGFTGDSTRAFIRLQPSHAVLQLHTIPAGAFVYPGDTEWLPSSEALGKTPYMVQEFDPGELRYRLSYPGYRDTLLQIVPDPTGNTQYRISLQPVIDKQELALQNARWNAMSRNRLGKGIMGASIAPILVGATFLWLAQSDYDDAASIKSKLTQPSAASGPNFEAQVDKNHKAVEDGNNKVKVGAALMISGAVLLGFGFSLWF